MSHNPDVIVGAGLAGLIAAHAWPRTSLVEAAPEPRETHRALLRFRDESVSNLTGIEFKKVRVRKGIWSRDEFRAPDIQLANLYAQKVLGTLGAGDRSIWNIEPVDRYIAPQDFYARLLDNVGPRISWGEKFEFDPAVRALNGERSAKLRVLSTAPLPIALNGLGISTGLEFTHAPIVVDRYEFENVDLYQTIYFPDTADDVYRASFTGSTLIVERSYGGVDLLAGGVPGGILCVENEVPQVVRRAFGLGFGRYPTTPNNAERVTQKYGKIAPVMEAVRKEILFKLTHEFGIYSLGRFATWRNVLLDDLVGDIAVVKKLLSTNNSAYELRKSI